MGHKNTLFSQFLDWRCDFQKMRPKNKTLISGTFKKVPKIYHNSLSCILRGILCKNVIFWGFVWGGARALFHKLKNKFKIVFRPIPSMYGPKRASDWNFCHFWLKNNICCWNSAEIFFEWLFSEKMSPKFFLHFPPTFFFVDLLEEHLSFRTHLDSWKILKTRFSVTFLKFFVISG